MAIAEYWVEFPVLYSRSLLGIYFMYGGVFMAIPISQFIPPPLIPLATIRIFFLSANPSPDTPSIRPRAPPPPGPGCHGSLVTGVTSCRASQSGFTLRGVRIPGSSPRLSSPACPPGPSRTHRCSGLTGLHARLAPPEGFAPATQEHIHRVSAQRFLSGCLPSCCCKTWPLPQPTSPLPSCPTFSSALSPLHTQASFLVCGLSVSSH